MGPAQGKEERANRSNQQQGNQHHQQQYQRPQAGASGGGETSEGKQPDTTGRPPASPKKPDTGGGGATSAAASAQGTQSYSLRAVQATCSKGQGTPSIIKWPDGQAKEVLVEGTFTNWSKGAVEMKRTDSEFMALVYLQPGVHTYRFIVDGQVMTDKDQPRIVHEKGHFNTIAVTDQSVLAESDEEEVSDLSSNTLKNYNTAKPHEKLAYTQVKWVFEETRKLPPLFPPHLRYTPLTSQSDARATQEKVLPTPYRATINHTYFQAREGYNVIGSTFRVNDKYSTVVYYRAQEEDCAIADHQDPNTSIEMF
eukprot:TRINITY_DN13989_c2_g1_i1.p1 TRINITY_DN13989_c2_g1~~TRINITY_DN13989_c2_g1_i1.p1  ORF type:complete len:326 (+),score=69.47 TRINITY_DN13989_c2_g1_i1:51-980(+)